MDPNSAMCVVEFQFLTIYYIQPVVAFMVYVIEDQGSKGLDGLCIGLGQAD